MQSQWARSSAWIERLPSKSLTKRAGSRGIEALRARSDISVFVWVPQIPFAFLYAPLKGSVYASTNGNEPSFRLNMARAFFSF